MQSRLIQSADGTRVRVVDFGGTGAPVLLVHGLAEHIGRYGHVAKALVDRGFHVSMVELRGHGESEGKRGHVNRWDEYVADLNAAYNACETPMIVAHSMGGLVTLDALRAGLRPPRVLLSNPLLGVRVKAPRIKVLAGRLLSRILPSVSLTNEVPSSGLSHDPAVARAYDADPMIFHTITPRWFTEMEAATVRVLAVRPAVPVAMLYSDADPITDTERAAEWAAEHGVISRDHPGMLHEIFNEVGKEAVLTEVADWLERGEF